MANTPFLRLETLSFSWPKQSQPTLQQLNFSIKEQAITAIIGPNGCGKSLLMQLIAGLKSTTQGRVSLYDSNIASFTPEARACQIAYLAPHIESCPMLTVQQILLSAGYAQPHNMNKKNYDFWLNTLNLSELEQRLLPTLSTGQQARVRLARTFLQGCPLIVMDEPFAHIDLPQAAALWHILKQLSQNHTIIIADHQLSLVAQHADEILILSHHNEWRIGSTPHCLTETNLNWAWKTQGYKLYHAPIHRSESYVGFTHITSPEVNS